jgi:2-polyprenyl-6-methoxyphenol hydroxylase-like FAD-dependent oxidoreductase
VHADGLVAFYARFRAGREGDRDARTLVESAPGGWWYTALVPGGERVVAWLTDADLADRATLLSEAGFCSVLGESRHVLDALHAYGYTIASRPRGADAGSARLDRFTGDGWIAAGDAALAFDPLSSQGILTALYTGMRAGQALHAHLGGDALALPAYEVRLEEIHRAYEENRSVFYGYEARWAHLPFWRRRAPAGVPAS